MHSSILAWKMLWTEEPGCQRVGQDLATEQQHYKAEAPNQGGYWYVAGKTDDAVNSLQYTGQPPQQRITIIILLVKPKDTEVFNLSDKQFKTPAIREFTEL